MNRFGNSAIYQYGRANAIDSAIALTDLTSRQIASIVLYWGNIENFTEQVIWKLNGDDLKSKRPTTDAKPFIGLLEMLEKHALELLTSEDQKFIGKWCEAARNGCTIRNTIVHSTTLSIDGVLVLMRNTRSEGVKRKRPFGDLWCDTDTMEMIRQSFAVLFRIIFGVVHREAIADIATPDALRALSVANSILGEFADRDYNPSFEKY